MAITTWAKNVNVHPGLSDINAKKKQCTKAEKAADDKHHHEELEAKEAAAIQGIECLAKIQANMKISQASAAAKKPRAVRPCPVAVKKKEGGPVGGLDTEGQADNGSGEGALTMEMEGGYKNIKNIARASKQSLKDAIDAAHLNLTRENHLPAHATDGKERSLPKMSTATTASKATMVISQVPPKPTPNEVPVAEDALVGGFDDADKIYESQEHDAVFQVSTWGRVPLKSIIQMMDSIKESPPPPTQPRNPACMVHLWRLPSEDSVLLVEDSKVYDITNDSADFDMDDSFTLVKPVVKQEPKVNMQIMVGLGAKKGSCTTSSTFVTMTDTKAPPSNKVKIEQADEHDISSTAKAKDSSTWAETFKAQSAYHNADLPPPCQDGQCWLKMFLPTIFLWAGCQPNIWSISNEFLSLTISAIFKVVYPEVQYAPTIQGAVIGVTNQCLSEWGSNFGSTTIAIIIDFMSHNEDTDVMELVGYLLTDYAFLYEDPDTLDKGTTYRSPFMPQLIGTAHLQATIGHADVPELKTGTLAKNGIVGVIAISVAALEHALMLIKIGCINIEDVLAAGPAQCRFMVKTPKVLNKATRKKTWTANAFSVNNWGSKTLAFSKSAWAKGDEAMKSIVSMA
ncbi:uncharacterized protein EDB91DRAFT_1084090 [Suillus paluster]|uniref:uncharacterized protein n=1 Tax=Suillus paluster TaxID=48578 RepID=UPI001B86FBAE|nr:uncharacterized protein EDB91DRAFT_1084090 [Suillus paluster]KAG1734436.1 hypothetical protein EDB91DRAFT_1084090 [Suillus paluster]